MADIELVIKIPEEMYEEMCIWSPARADSAIYTAVREGIPLPKGHGRLIDERDLSLMTVHMIDGIIVCDALTIIEADEGE